MMSAPQAVDFATPDLADAAPEAQAVILPWLDFGASRRFSGRVVTIKCFEDNSLIKALLQTPGEGRVIIVDGGESRRRALLGDQLAASAVKNGWSGLVIAGAVRDVELLESMELGVKALGSCPQKTDKRGEGQQDIPIELAGVRIHSGDFVYADASGVLVSRTALV